MAGKKQRDTLPLKVQADSAWTYAHSLLSPFVGSRSNSFFIFAQGRTGSTLLCNLLNSHPDIFCEQEILFHERLSPLCYTLGREARAPAEKMYGFKVKIYQLEGVQGYGRAERFVYALVDRGWTPIYLWRRNIFRQCISARMAWRKDLWHADEESRERVDAAVEIVPDKLIEDIQFRLRNRERERAIVQDLNCFEINYEDDLCATKAQQETLSDLFGGLGLQDHQVETSMRKTGKRDLSEQVSNYDEVRSAVISHGFGEYL